MQVSGVGQSVQHTKSIDPSHLAVFNEIDHKIVCRYHSSIDYALEVIRDLASKVESYMDINAYHQAMKEIKRNYHKLEPGFTQSLKKSHDYLDHSDNELLKKALNFCTDDLSLVTDHELKYQLKLEEGFSETNHAYDKLLIDGGWAANPQLSQLLISQKLDSLSPGCLALVLQDALTETIESKQVIRMLYRFVGCYFFEAIADVYKDLVPTLRGVSAAFVSAENIRKDSMEVQREKSESPQDRVKSEHCEKEEKASVSTTVDVTGLINNWDVPSNFDGVDEGSISEIDLDQLTPDTTIQTLEKNDVAKLIEKLSFNRKLNEAEYDSPEAVRSAIKEALAQLSGEGMLTVIDRVSENIVNLVSHLFENIVNSEQLISEVSVQISRAQLPVMRLALSDTKLFQSPDHPARQYINRLGEFGLKISDAKEEGFDHLRCSVDELLEKFDGNQDVYGELLEDLNTYIEGSTYSSACVDDGLSADVFQTEHQCHQALKFLATQHALLSNELVFHRFLKVVWGAVLSHIAEGVGVDSDQWGEATDLYSVIIWSTQADSNEQGKKQVLRRLPKMMTGVRKIFDDYDLSDEVRRALLEQMMRIHLSIIRGTDGKRIVEDASMAVSAFESCQKGILEKNRKAESGAVRYAGDSVVIEQPAIATSANQLVQQNTPINDDSDSQVDSEGAIQERVIAGVKGSTNANALSYLNIENDLSNSYKHCLTATKDIDFGEISDVDAMVDLLEKDEQDHRAIFSVPEKGAPFDFKQQSNKTIGEKKKNNKVIVSREERSNLVREIFAQVGRMNLGALIECDENNTIVRYQLTHKSTIFGKYTFNDFRRRKSWVLSKPELVMELAKGRAKIISAPKLFDDTLESVVAQIQRQRH